MRWAEGNAKNASEFHSTEVKFDGDKDLSRMAVFDYVIGNTDRHDNNWMVSEKGKLQLIDHGLTFNTNAEKMGNGYAGRELFKRMDAGKFKEDLGALAKGYSSNKDQIVKALAKTGLDRHKIEAVKTRIDNLTNAAGDWEKFRGPRW